MSVSSVECLPTRRRGRGVRVSRRFFSWLGEMVFVCALLFVAGIGAEPAAASASEVAPVAAPAERSASNAAPTSFEELLAGFASMPGFEARFIEEKTLSLLAIPLRSEGRIYFAPPSFLLRDVTLPTPQKVLVSASQVRLSSGGREEVIDLASRAEVRPLIESLIWLFTGDRAALESAFGIEFVDSRAESGGSEGWTLRLSPKEEPLSQLIARLVIRGDGLGARQIDVEEVSGDRSVMQILDANPNRHYSPAEFESLFRSSPKSNAVTGSND